MRTYRVYCLDGSGSIEQAHWLEAQCDDDALLKLHDMPIGSRCELWDRDRLVGEVVAPSPY